MYVCMYVCMYVWGLRTDPATFLQLLAGRTSFSTIALVHLASLCGALHDPVSMSVFIFNVNIRISIEDVFVLVSIFIRLAENFRYRSLLSPSTLGRTWEH